MVAVCLDKRPATPISSHVLSNTRSLNRDKSVSLDGHFHQIGSVEASVFLDAQAMASKKKCKTADSTKSNALSGALDGKSGTAYNTPVINDANLLPVSTKSSTFAESLIQKTKDVTSTVVERCVHFFQHFPRNITNIKFLCNEHRPYPSHVGDIDMIRIRAAEKVILEEETSQGRMMRDQYGRLVPEALRSSLDARNAAAGDYDRWYVKNQESTIQRFHETKVADEYSDNTNPHIAQSSNQDGFAKGKYDFDVLVSGILIEIMVNATLYMASTEFDLTNSHTN